MPKENEKQRLLTRRAIIFGGLQAAAANPGDPAAMKQLAAAESTLGGTLGQQFFATSAPTTRDQHVIYDQATGVLSYDHDGSGARPTIAFAQVTPGTVLDHNDFLIV